MAANKDSSAATEDFSVHMFEEEYARFVEEQKKQTSARIWCAPEFTGGAGILSHTCASTQNGVFENLCQVSRYNPEMPERPECLIRDSILVFDGSVNDYATFTDMKDAIAHHAANTNKVK